MCVRTFGDITERRWSWQGRSWAILLTVTVVPLALATCSTTPTSAHPSSRPWTAAVTARAKSACEQGGGTPSECGCAVSYLKGNGYLSAAPDQRQTIMQAATDACAPQVAVPSTGPATTTSTESSQQPLIRLIPPATTSLDWTGFVIQPNSCQVTSISQVRVSGAGTVPSLAGRGQVAGEIEAWAVDQDGRVAYGQPAQIPDAAGPYNWVVQIPIVAGSQIVQCEVQGIDPDDGYTDPQ